MKIPTQLCGDYFIKHEIRIPINLPGFNGKYPGPPGFLTVAHLPNSRSSVRILGFYMVISGDNATEANLSYRLSLGNDPGTLDLETNSGSKVLGKIFGLRQLGNLGVDYYFSCGFLWRNLERSNLVQ